MASPPRSPPRSGYLRRSWTSLLVAFEAVLDGASICPCRFEVPRLSCSCASPTVPRVCGFGIDLRRSGIPGCVVLLTALSGGGAWLAPAWPRFGAVVAGPCHHVAMDVSRCSCHILFYSSSLLSYLLLPLVTQATGLFLY
jgi:hypothetical protein